MALDHYEDIRVNMLSSCTQTFLRPDGVILYPDKQKYEDESTYELPMNLFDIERVSWTEAKYNLRKH